MTFRRVVGAAAVCLFAWSGPAYAQGMGSIFGKVTDTSGGVLPGVTVTVTGTGLQQPLVAATGESGAYQFPSVPIGTYTVTFELASFKKVVRPNIVITSGFNAQIDPKLEIGQMTEEVTVSGAAPVVDTKKTTTGAVFTADILEKIPTARDPWQIINMTPGVQAGLNVGGSSSGQQVGLESRGTGANVQWNLEGGSITDLSSNSSPSYFNFDSFSEIQVTNGGGDVSVQSSGLAINLITKSGSNVFKGSVVGTFENDDMQGQNVTKELFDAGANGFISGNPIKRISVFSAEYGGPIVKNRLWFWGAADHQDINVGITNFFDATQGAFCQELVESQREGTLDNAISYDNLGDVQSCLSNDKTVIKNLQWKFNYQLNGANKFQYLFQSDNKYRNARGANANTLKEATTQQTSDKPWGLPLPTHSLSHTLIATDRLVFNNMFTYVHGGFFLDYQDVPPQGDCGQSIYLGADSNTPYARDGGCLWNIQALNNRTTGINSRSLVSTYQTVRHSWEVKTDGTYFATNKLGGDHSLKFGLGWRRAPIMTFSHYSGGGRARVQCVNNDPELCGDGTGVAVGSGAGLVPFQAVLYRDNLLNNDWWTYNGYIQDSYSRGRWRINGGLRYDWQQSKYLGGCVAPNILRPDLLPAQCEEETMTDASNGREIQPFGNWSPRVSATYDLFGSGKTQVHASGSYYYDTKITLANSLGGISSLARLTWGSNRSDGLQHGRGRVVLERRQSRPGDPAERADRDADLEHEPAGPDDRHPVAGGEHRRSQHEDRTHARSDRRHAARAHGELRGRCRLHLPEVRSRDGGLSGRLPAGRSGLPAGADLRAGDLLRSGNGDLHAVLRRVRHLLAAERRRHHRDEPELPDLPRRGSHGDQAVQQPLAAADSADAPDQPAVLPRGIGDVRRPDGARVPARREHRRALHLQGAGQLPVPVGHHRVGEPERQRRRCPRRGDRRTGRRLRRPQCRWRGDHHPA